MIAHEHLRISREYQDHISGVNVFTEIVRELAAWKFDADTNYDYMALVFFEPISTVEDCKRYIEKYFSVKVEYCIFDENDEYETVSDLEPTDEVYGLIVRI